MKVITPQLQALFSTGLMNYCKLFEFRPIGSSPLYYASSDVDILVPVSLPYVAEDGVTVYTAEDGTTNYVTEATGYQLFTAGKSVGPYFDRKDNKAKMHCKIGLQVDTLTFDVIPGSAMINGTSFLNAIGEGFFDGCEVIYYGAYWPKPTLMNALTAGATVLQISDHTIFPATGNFNILVNKEIMTVTGGQGTNNWTVTRGVNPSTAVAHKAGDNIIQLGSTRAIPATGIITKFVGNVAEIDSSRNLATFSINSYLELLNQNMPINLYQTTCVNSLYDTSCTLLAANFTTASAALSGSTNSTINANLSQATGYFSLGTITFTGGANSGVSRTIKLHTQSSPSTVTLILPLPSTPAAGDTFNIIPGCDKLQQTCAVKYNNLGNFRGFPFIPTQESAS